MTWLEMANLLDDKSQALSPRGAHVHLDTAGWLRTWTPHQNLAADLAARHFAKHLEWPPMDPDQASQLYFRALYALESCIDSHSRGEKLPLTESTQQEALEQLLVEDWHLEGLEWAERRYGPPKSRVRVLRPTGK